MLAVAPSARGTRRRAALVDLVVDGSAARAPPHGDVDAPRMRAAHRIYERAGFVRAPERDWSPVPGVDLVGYRLELAT